MPAVPITPASARWTGPPTRASMAPMVEIHTIGFDADDTLWHNETFFDLSQKRFFELVGDHADAATLKKSLFAVEKRNLALYGYGIKGFTLSMIETALEVTEGRLPGTTVAEILAIGRSMLEHPVEPLPGVRETLEALAGEVRLVLITKGDLLHQEQKIARSGLGDFFDALEIVSEKDADTYRRIFARHGSGPLGAAMVGNSLRSDILPAIEAGSWGLHVPYHIVWEHEHAEAPPDLPRLVTLETIEGVLGWWAEREAG